MSLFNRITIGTANWGKPYRGIQVPRKDKEHILETAYKWGIDTIDTAVAYENDVYDLVDTTKWKVVDKIKSFDIMKKWTESFIYAILWHGSIHDKSIWDYLYSLQGVFCGMIGSSIYSDDIGDVPAGVLQISYNPYDHLSIEFINKMDKGNMELHVRSIFCACRALKDFTAQQCLAFALMNQKIDKVILGFDSFDQFQEDLEWIHDLESKASNDPDVYDTRRF